MGVLGAWGVLYLFFAGCQGFNGLFGFRLAICKTCGYSRNIKSNNPKGHSMFISQVNIENFKCFKQFPLKLNAGTNIIVGDNEAGKSTILEAIHLALSGMFNGRYLKNELSQYLFNKEVEEAYIASLITASPQAPPHILIELFMEGVACPELAILEGNDNKAKTSACGISFSIEFDEEYQPEYAAMVATRSIKTIPIEYYKVIWRSFARDAITARTIPIKSALIDSTNARFRNGSDVYISRIIRENLDSDERVEISQAHRQMKETFMGEPSIQAINHKINQTANISDKNVEISVDLATQNAWESSLMTYLDKVPFHYIGKGEQSIVKTNLAMSHSKPPEANVILLEEPENHLSHSKLNQLINKIQSNLGDKQIIISTHSSFVANKLNLGGLIFLNNPKVTRLHDLPSDTQMFFSKLAGYDTLRFILCKKAILVEGGSDEMVVQAAYMQENGGRLPIEDGIDVISVGTSFLRFLQIAERIDKKVVVMTDNDGDVAAVNSKYADYMDNENIKICFDAIVDTGGVAEFNYNTLEPSLLRVNRLDVLNHILGKNYNTNDELLKFMKANKTDCALKIFQKDQEITFPQYILDAIDAIADDHE